MSRLLNNYIFAFTTTKPDSTLPAVARRFLDTRLNWPHEIDQAVDATVHIKQYNYHNVAIPMMDLLITTTDNP